jgi:hypothetical protein
MKKSVEKVENLYFRAFKKDQKYFIKATKGVHQWLVEILQEKKYKMDRINSVLYYAQVLNSQRLSSENFEEIDEAFDPEIQTAEISSQKDLKYFIDIDNNGFDAMAESYSIFKNNYRVN